MVEFTTILVAGDMQIVRIELNAFLDDMSRQGFEVFEPPHGESILSD